MDRNAILRAAGGRFIVELIIKILYAVDNDLELYLKNRIQLYWSLRIVQRTSCLDLPTFTDEKTGAQLESSGSNRRYPDDFISTSWEAFTDVVSLFTCFVSIASELTVMLSVFREHSEAPFLLVGSCISILAKRLYNHVRRPERGSQYFSLKHILEYLITVTFHSSLGLQNDRQRLHWERWP